MPPSTQRPPMARCAPLAPTVRDFVSAAEPDCALRTATRPQVQARPADQARILVRLGGMADQAGGLVDHQQLAVFIDNLE